jgi:hypothetical protein
MEQLEEHVITTYLGKGCERTICKNEKLRKKRRRGTYLGEGRTGEDDLRNWMIFREVTTERPAVLT